MSVTETDSAPAITRAATYVPPFSAATLGRHVWKLAIPAIGENLLQTALVIIDMIMISFYGSVPVAAAVAAGTILWRTHMTLGCIDRGTTAMVARFYGEGNIDKVARTVAQSIWLALVIGVGQSVIGIAYAGQMVRWLGADAEVAAAAVPYLRVIFLASAARMFFFVAAAALRGVGDTRSPMWIAMWMNLLNAGFNYLLIFGHWGFPELKLLGSGCSTSIAIFFSAAAVGFVVFRGRSVFHLKLRHFRPDFGIMRTIVRIAIPAFAEEIIVSIGWFIFFGYIARMGTTILAAHGIASRIESVSYMAGFGFSVAAATLVGQSLGMRKEHLARRSFRRTTAYSVLVMAVIAAALIQFGSLFVRAFHPTPEVLEIARMLLIIAAIEQPLLGITMTLGGGLRGAGDTFTPMLSSIVGNILIRIFVVHWLAFECGYGIYGVYIGTVIDWLVRSAMLFGFYFHGRWARLKLEPHN